MEYMKGVPYLKELSKAWVTLFSDLFIITHHIPIPVITHSWHLAERNKWGEMAYYLFLWSGARGKDWAPVISFVDCRVTSTPPTIYQFLLYANLSLMWYHHGISFDTNNIAYCILFEWPNNVFSLILFIYLSDLCLTLYSTSSSIMHSGWRKPDRTHGRRYNVGRKSLVFIRLHLSWAWNAGHRTYMQCENIIILAELTLIY